MPTFSSYLPPLLLLTISLHCISAQWNDNLIATSTSEGNLFISYSSPDTLFSYVLAPNGNTDYRFQLPSTPKFKKTPSFAYIFHGRGYIETQRFLRGSSSIITFPDGSMLMACITNSSSLNLITLRSDGSKKNETVLDTGARSDKESPYLFLRPDGQILLSWVEYKAKSITYQVINRHGDQIGEKQVLISGIDLGSVLPVLKLLSSNNLLVFYHQGGNQRLYGKIYKLEDLRLVTDSFLISERPFNELAEHQITILTNGNVLILNKKGGYLSGVIFNQQGHTVQDFFIDEAIGSVFCDAIAIQLPSNNIIVIWGGVKDPVSGAIFSEEGILLKPKFSIGPEAESFKGIMLADNSILVALLGPQTVSVIIIDPNGKNLTDLFPIGDKNVNNWNYWVGRNAPEVISAQRFANGSVAIFYTQRETVFTYYVYSVPSNPRPIAIEELGRPIPTLLSENVKDIDPIQLLSSSHENYSEDYSDNFCDDMTDMVALMLLILTAIGIAVFLLWKKAIKLIQRNKAYTSLELNRSRTLSYTNEESLVTPEHETHIPKDFLCSLTQEIMVDPYILISDKLGFNVYEKSAIDDWLRNHDSDPITKHKKVSLVRYDDLKERIEGFMVNLWASQLQEKMMCEKVRKWIEKRGRDTLIADDG